MQAFAGAVDATFLQMLRRTMGGSEVVSQDTRTQARDTQFELYIAALLRLAGREVHFAEPDLRFTLGAIEVGVAAKRLQSGKKYGTRLKEAIRQLERAKLPGVVAFSLDQLLPPGSLIDSGIDGLAVSSPRMVDAILEPYRDITLRAVAGKPVLAILGSVVATAIARQDNALGRIASLLVRVIESNVTPEQYSSLRSLSGQLGPPHV